MFVVNLVARSLIVIIGIGIAFRFQALSLFESPLQEILGIVVSLFGVYRLVILFSRRDRTSEDEG